MRKSVLVIVATILLSLTSQSITHMQANVPTTDMIYIFNVGDDDEYLDFVLENIAPNLESLGYTVVTEKPDDSRPYAALALGFFEYYTHSNNMNAYVSVGLEPSTTPPIKQISPVLLGSFDEIDGDQFIQTNYPKWLPESISFIFSYVTGLSLYTLGDCKAAMPYLEDAADIFSDFPYAAANLAPNLALKFYLGNCSLLLGNTEQAIEFYHAAAYPESSFYPLVNRYPAASNLVWVYMNTGRKEMIETIIDELIAPFSREYENCPPPSVGRCEARLGVILPKRAQLYALAERYDDAINDLNTAIDLSPDNPELYTLRGQIYLALYEWDSALADFNQAIELNRDYADAYYQRGILYYSILQTGVELRPNALADFQQYLELAPEGEHAEDAARYVEQITAELAALEG